LAVAGVVNRGAANVTMIIDSSWGQGFIPYMQKRAAHFTASYDTTDNGADYIPSSLVLAVLAILVLATWELKHPQPLKLSNSRN